MSVLVNARRFLAQILVNARSGVLVNARGKPPGFTQACGNRLFTASDDSGSWRGYLGPTRRGKAAEGPLRAGKGCLEPRLSFLGDPEILSRPLAPCGLSSGDASGGTGGISGTTDLRCPPAQTCRGRPRIAKTWRGCRRSQGSPCLRPRCGLSAFFPSNSGRLASTEASPPCVWRSTPGAS